MHLFGFELHGYVMCAISSIFTVIEDDVTGQFKKIEVFCGFLCVLSLH